MTKVGIISMQKVPNYGSFLQAYALKQLLLKAGADLELKNNWNRAIVYGQAARKHALIRHDRKAIVDDLIQTYQEIIDDK